MRVYAAELEKVKDKGGGDRRRETGRREDVPQRKGLAKPHSWREGGVLGFENYTLTNLADHTR
jgi:hypothetical protein